MKKPNVEYRGHTVLPRFYCPDCGYTFRPSYRDNDLHVIKEYVFEKYCPMCGVQLDKENLKERMYNVMETGKDDLSDDLLGN